MCPVLTKYDIISFNFSIFLHYCQIIFFSAYPKLSHIHESMPRNFKNILAEAEILINSFGKETEKVSTN